MAVLYHAARCRVLFRAPFAVLRVSVARGRSLGALPGTRRVFVASPSWLGLRLGWLPACSPSALAVSSSFCWSCAASLRVVSFSPVGGAPSGLVASARVVSILGRFRAVRLVHASGRPAVAFAGSAGSAGSALLFSRVLSMFSRGSEVRTWLFMRVSSMNRLAEWPFSPVLGCSQAVLGGSSWPRCYMVVALLT